MRAHLSAIKTAKHPVCRLCRLSVYRPNTFNIIIVRGLSIHHQIERTNYYTARSRQASSSTKNNVQVEPLQNQSLLRVNTGIIENDQPKIQLPQGKEASHTETWAKLIDSLLPLEFCKDKQANLHSKYAADEFRAEVFRVVSFARKNNNIDILSHLAVEQGRWGAYLWLCSFLIASSKGRKQIPISKEGLTDWEWPRETSLSALSTDNFLLPRKQNDTLHPYLSIDAIATSSTLDPLLGLSALDHIVLGEVWRSLGQILLESSRKEEDELQTMISKCLLVIAHLHHAGFIPERAHQYIPNPDPSALVQPPLLHNFSDAIISSLLDSVSAFQQIEDNEHFDIDAPIIELGLPEHAARLGPEIWLEFVLWCCVHGGWHMYGAAIVQEMKRIPLPWRWSLKLDRKLIAAASGTSYLISERTLSPDVVIALIQGLLISLAQATSENSAHRPIEIIQQLGALKRALNNESMNLRSLTWNTVVARLSDTPEVDILTSPKLASLYVLPLAEAFETERQSMNSLPVFNNSKTDFSYLFQDSSAILGLYYQTIQAHIKGKDLRSALQVLGQLQVLTDKNKLDSLGQFLRRLTSIPLDNGKRTSRSLAQLPRLPSRQLNLEDSQTGAPGYFPDVPVSILASLIDLIIDNEYTQVGHWMIYSNDVDGPWIPEKLYGNQTIAPSLIRFAVSTKDWRFLAKLRKASAKSVFASTLVALSCSQIAQGDFSGAGEILGIVYSHYARGWDMETFTSIFRTLVVYGNDSVLADVDERATVTRFVQALTGNDSRKVRGVSEKQLLSLVGLVASCDVPIQALFTRILADQRDYMLDLPIESFVGILTGAMQIGGSGTGKRLWEQWCSDEKAILVRAEKRAAGNDKPISKLALFSQDPNSTPQPPQGYAVFVGNIPPTLPALRLIIRRALHEHRHILEVQGSEKAYGAQCSDYIRSREELSSGKTSAMEASTSETPQTILSSTSKRHEVLEWTAQILHCAPFNMNYSDIVEELEGYMPSLARADD